MEKQQNKNTNWTICLECQGLGKKKQRIRKKAKIHYQLALEKFKKNNTKETPPAPPKTHFNPCLNCSGSGLIASKNHPIADTENHPHVAIIGAGIGGVALAVACLHRRIPFTLFERDISFDSRSQGYGLTLQQASKAIKAFGIQHLEKSVISTRHLVHTTEGKVIGEWGMRKWTQPGTNSSAKRTNIHIARQSLRSALLNQLNGHKTVQWGHKLIGFKEQENQPVNLTFLVNGKTKLIKADLVVGADGIRSTTRKLLLGENNTPLRYLNCIVILGICPLKKLTKIKNDLLDSATVFQTANGNERIYMMPYSADAIMWQLSFPMSEKEAKSLSFKGTKALKKEASIRTQWHNPIPQIIAATEESLISGYPVYDRDLISPELLEKGKKTTLIGDAAHPMSPFKGQGANQALLDALSLTREITKNCRPLSEWKKHGLRKSVLTHFETEMLTRSASKVKGSADAVKSLHSQNILHKRNGPRGFLKEKRD